ncbi:hypothetical protein C8J57DRAFT_286137 [Mycena rebaudengoi]|nr:hypothetical protein C8J57DRAFT_286137 [Mycena rebaudengoi]
MSQAPQIPTVFFISQTHWNSTAPLRGAPRRLIYFSASRRPRRWNALCLLRMLIVSNISAVRVLVSPSLFYFRTSREQGFAHRGARLHPRTFRHQRVVHPGDLYPLRCYLVPKLSSRSAFREEGLTIRCAPRQKNLRILRGRQDNLNSNDWLLGNVENTAPTPLMLQCKTQEAMLLPDKLVQMWRVSSSDGFKSKCGFA